MTEENKDKEVFLPIEFVPVFGQPFDVAQFKGSSLVLPTASAGMNAAIGVDLYLMNENVKKVVDQYKSFWHAQNTIVDYGNSEVVHYQSAVDFGKDTSVNSSRQRKDGRLDKRGLGDTLLKDVVNEKGYDVFVHQMTGLKEPSVLVEIGDYFHRPARLWFPWIGKDGAGYNHKRAAWLGCFRSLSFSISTYYGLGDRDAARGVRER